MLELLKVANGYLLQHVHESIPTQV